MICCIPKPALKDCFLHSSIYAENVNGGGGNLAVDQGTEVGIARKSI
jgi:hypothetical protein